MIRWKAPVALALLVCLHSTSFGADMMPAAPLHGAGQAGMQDEGEAGEVPGLDELLTAIAAYDFGGSRIALSEVEGLVREACRSPSKKKYVAKRMADLLESDATFGGKQFVCRQLSLIGSGEQIPVLAGLLLDEQMTDMARYALERIPGPAVDAALRKALERTAGRARIGIINTLGLRRDLDAVASLGRLLEQGDGETAAAAMAALGSIGSEAAYRILSKAMDESPEERRLLALDACLACAERLVQDKESPEIVPLYLKLYAPSEPSHIRIAALNGMIGAAGERGGKVISDILERGDTLMRTYALQAVRTVPGPQITRDLAEGLSALPVEIKVHLLAALGARGDRAALPAVLSASKSTAAPVRASALAALAALGDSSCIPFLARRAAYGEGEECTAARAGLISLRDPEAGRALLEGIGISPDRIKVELIRGAGMRRTAASAPVLLGCAGSRDKAVRLEAVKMLRLVADPDLLPELVQCVAGAKSAAERSEAVETVVSVACRIPDENHRSAAVLRALPGMKNKKVVCALFEILGKIGSADALPALRSALEDESDEVKGTALQMLCNWPDDAPLPDLLETVRAGGNVDHAAAALHGAVRLIGINPERPVRATLDLYRETMALAKEPDDRKKVLAGLARVRHLDALEMARSYFREEAIREEAQMSAVKIAKAVCNAYPQEVRPVLDMILRTSRNEEIRDLVQEVFDLISRFEDYITAWKVSGPYTMKNKSGAELFDLEFAPEKPKNVRAEWRIMPAGTDQDRPWLMELDRVIGGDDRCAYLGTFVWSPKDQEVLLELGSDDGIKVWLNRSLIHANNASRGCSPGQDKVRTVLNEGWSELMLKITQGGGGWAACARFRAPDGGKADGVKSRLE